MIIKVKGNKAQCPHCKKWCKLTWNEDMQQNEFKCCKAYGLHKRLKGNK